MRWIVMHLYAVMKITAFKMSVHLRLIFKGLIYGNRDIALEIFGDEVMCWIMCVVPSLIAAQNPILNDIERHSSLIRVPDLLTI